MRGRVQTEANQQMSKCFIVNIFDGAKALLQHCFFSLRKKPQTKQKKNHNPSCAPRYLTSRKKQNDTKKKEKEIIATFNELLATCALVVH